MPQDLSGVQKQEAESGDEFNDKYCYYSAAFLCYGISSFPFEYLCIHSKPYFLDDEQYYYDKDEQENQPNQQQG